MPELSSPKSRGISFFFFFFFTSPNIALNSSSLADSATFSCAVLGPKSTGSPLMVVLSMVSGAGVVGSASAPRGSSVKTTFFFFFLRLGSNSGSSDMVVLSQ